MKRGVVEELVLSKNNIIRQFILIVFAMRKMFAQRLACHANALAEAGGKIAFSEMVLHSKLDIVPEIFMHLAMNTAITEDCKLLRLHSKIKEYTVPVFGLMYIQLFENKRSSVQH